MCLFAKETGHEIVILRIKPVTKKTKSNVNIEHLLMKNLSPTWKSLGTNNHGIIIVHFWRFDLGKRYTRYHNKCQNYAVVVVKS
jgi:hypothetical protein